MQSSIVVTVVLLAALVVFALFTICAVPVLFVKYLHALPGSAKLTAKASVYTCAGVATLLVAVAAFAVPMLMQLLVAYQLPTASWYVVAFSSVPLTVFAFVFLNRGSHFDSEAYMEGTRETRRLSAS